ncbi:unnamed protein product, partial [marine sediment metagenome]
LLFYFKKGEGGPEEIVLSERSDWEEEGVAIDNVDTESNPGSIQLSYEELDAWESKTPPPGPTDPDKPLSGWTTHSYQNKIYVVGGRLGLNDFLDTVKIYDPQTDSWDNSGSTQPQRRFHAGALFDGKIYMIGGEDEEYNSTNTVFVYNIATDSWGTAANLPTTLVLASASVYGNRIYVIGGSIDPNSSDCSSTDIIYQYNPEENSWSVSAVSPLPYISRYHQSEVVNEELFVIGGSCVIYDPGEGHCVGCLDYPGYEDQEHRDKMAVYNFSSSSWEIRDL